MIPGIGTIVNGVCVLVVGILSRVIFKKEPIGPGTDPLIKIRFLL